MPVLEKIKPYNPGYSKKSCQFFGYPQELHCPADCQQYEDCMKYLEEND
jgi:hypothetical protein